MPSFITLLFWAAYAISLYIASVLIVTFLENRGKIRLLPPLRRYPRVTICIPAYNEEDSIAMTIQSALKLDYPNDKLELIVIDDGSQDRTYAIASQFKKENVIVIKQENSGKANALNYALKKATGDYFACLDADSKVMPHALKKMIPCFDGANVGAVTPLMKVWKPRTLIQKGQWLEYTIYAFTKMILSTVDCIHVTPGPFSIYDKKLLLKYGGFDETSIVEDQEIAFRLQKHHHRIVQAPDGDVYTIAPRTVKELYAQRSRWYRGSLLNLIRYRGMIFNRAYGDFGMFHLPTLVIGSAFISVVVLSLFFSLTVIPLYELLQRLWLIDFNISPYFRDGASIIDMLVAQSYGVDYAKLFIVVALLAINVKLFIWAYYNTKEEFTMRQILSFIFFFFVYYLLLSGMWIISILEIFIGRKKWSYARDKKK